MSPKAFVIHKQHIGFEVLFSFRGRNIGACHEICKHFIKESCVVLRPGLSHAYFSNVNTYFQNNLSNIFFFYISRQVFRVLSIFQKMCHKPCNVDSVLQILSFFHLNTLTEACSKCNTLLSYFIVL